MASPAPKQAASPPAAKAAAPARKRRALLWGAVALLLLGGGGGGLWYTLAAHAAAKPAVRAAAAPAAAIYYKFDPAFVVNFGTPGATRYLQIALEAMARDQAVIDIIKNNDPAVRNDLILLFSSQNYDNLVTAAGKEQLRVAALAAIRKVVTEVNPAAKPVEAVYFTSFVIQ